VFRRPHLSHYNRSRTPQCGWSLNWDYVSISHQDSSSCSGCLYVGAFNANYVQWCTRYTWRNAQPTCMTTLLRQLPAVRRVPACGHLHVIPTSLPGCVPSSETERYHTLVLQPEIRYQLTFVPKLVKYKFKKLLKTHCFNLAFSSYCVFHFRDSSCTLFYIL